LLIGGLQESLRVMPIQAGNRPWRFAVRHPWLTGNRCA
jgi:hypothetical protein